MVNELVLVIFTRTHRNGVLREDPADIMEFVFSDDELTHIIDEELAEMTSFEKTYPEGKFYTI